MSGAGSSRVPGGMRTGESLPRAPLGFVGFAAMYTCLFYAGSKTPGHAGLCDWTANYS